MQAPRSTMYDLSYDDCNVNRHNQGKPYPRTCRICGLSQCRYNFTPKPQEEDGLRNLDEYFEDAAVTFLTKRDYRVFPGAKQIIMPASRATARPDDEQRALDLLHKRGYVQL